MNVKEALNKIKAILSGEELPAVEVEEKIEETVVDETVELAEQPMVEEPIAEQPEEEAKPDEPSELEILGAKVQELENLVQQILDKLNGAEQKYSKQNQAIGELLNVVEKLSTLPTVEPTPTKESFSLPKSNKEDLIARLAENINEAKKNFVK